jgi:hypothetical protein
MKSLCSQSRLISFFLFNFCGAFLFAQSTDISVGTTTLQPSVKRLGMNLGTVNFYDSGQMTQNLIMQNPGFEGQIWNSTIRCLSGTATSCVDEDQWAAWPAGFWNGATFQVFYGAAAGRTGTITTSTATSQATGQGVTLNFSTSGVAPAQGDYLIVRKTVPGGSTGGWWPSTSGAGTIGDNLTDLPPGTLGKQTTVLTAPGASDSATMSGFFDSVIGRTFLQLNGTYQLQFKAKGIGGSNQIGVLVGRAGLTPYLSQTVTLTNSWNTYNLTFNAAENGSVIALAGVTFSTVGADSFELDDAMLTQINGDATNTTVFRDPVVAALRTLQPGVLRYWAGGAQLGETLDNLLTPQFGRQRAGDSAWQTESDAVDYGLHDFLVLCQTIGAEPWFVVPTTFSATDASNLIEYLAGASTTPYGAKRAALGQATPWTEVFGKIHLEFGNEAWNSTFKGGDIEYSAPYGGQAQTIFGVMRANPAYVPASFDLVLGGQAAWPGRNSDIQNNCNNNDTFAIAPYTMGTVSSFSDNESLFGSTFAEPEAYMSSTGTAEGLTPGMVYQDYQAIQGSSHPVPLNFYEINLSTVSGSITQAALNGYVSSLGAGLMAADTMLLSLRQFGVLNQQLWSLPQYQFQRTDGSEVYLFGAVVDMGATNRKRPQFLALEMANQALSNGAAMLQTVHTGADPTWDQPLVNSVQLNGAHYLHSFAFAQGSNLSAVVFNLSRTSSLPVTFSGPNAPVGAVQMQQLTSANLTDTNENSNVVSITPSTLNSFNPAAGLSLPPYSMTVLTWTAGTTSVQAPVISAVAATSITGTSATITWKTDQASSSLVNYGTTSAYGSSSGLNSALSTSHSVTLGGLTSGVTYDFAVVSANSAGSSTTSANFTFVTAAPPVGAPVISAVTANPITGTSASVTWTTDQASSSLVNYGTTSAYGSSSVLKSALLTSHSVILNGLTPGTTYDYAVVSANSTGSSATSANFTFVTLPQAVGSPVITAVTATAVTSTSATINWTTDQASSSMVSYGTTTAYGSSSPLNSTMITSHSAILNGLTPGTTYDYAAVSANAAGNSTTSANFNFSTPGSASGSAATYSGLDTTTQGAWTARYGADGYFIANYASNSPTYATVSLIGDSLWTWASPTSDPRALETSSGLGIASTYYASSSFTINVNLTDGNTHRIALYLLDWDSTLRTETVSVLDAATNTVLSTQTFSSFQDGEYASWNVTGNVLIQVTANGGENAVVAGVFFGPPPPTSSASVTYNGLDTTTQGAWTDKYGADGDIIANGANNTPAYAAVSMLGQSAWTWANPSADPRALEISRTSSSRIASTYYATGGFTINVNFTDGNTHPIALYLLDWDTNSRVETISIMDATTHAILNTQTFSSFHDGEYVSWNIKGNVLIQVTGTAGENAVVAGVFFGTAVPTSFASAAYNGLDTTTLGTWTGNYGADGYIIANDATNSPAYATVNLKGDSLWTWANPTWDTRALQISSGSSGRIASAYFSPSFFDIGISLTDGNAHRIALYLLDWDTTLRVQTISILDANTNAVLNAQTYSSFQGGEYASWTVTGNVIMRVTATAGLNAVVAGIFFDPVTPTVTAPVLAARPD